MTGRRARAIVLMSGGMDSAACAHLYLSRGLAVEALFVDHGQAAAGPESRAVVAMAAYLRIPLRRFAVTGVVRSGVGELVGRNAFLISAALLVTGGRAGLIGLGIHAGTPYFDCSETFAKSMSTLVREQTDGKVAVDAPFISWRKSDIYSYFRKSQLPIMLTYSCESGGDSPCGLCASCRDRRAIEC
jgi:7-cyano-7-deazaguanine synthase